METFDKLIRRLEQFNDIGASLSSERNLHLHFEILRTDSLHLALGGSARQIPASSHRYAAAFLEPRQVDC